MNLKTFGLVAALSLLSIPAHAAGCDDVGALLKAAYPDAKSDAGSILVAGDYSRRVTFDEVACKVWPYKEELTLLAVPLKEDTPPDADVARGDVELLVAETATGKPLARRLEVGMADADAIRFDGVTLDTARYDITPDLRAFGVVTEQSGSSRVNPYQSRALWLYSFKDGRIDRVLDGLVVGDFSGENDGNCTGATVEIKRDVSILPESTDGYSDLGIEETSVTTNAKDVNGQCVSETMPAEKTERRLQYRDARYRSETEVTGLFSFIELRPAP